MTTKNPIPPGSQQMAPDPSNSAPITREGHLSVDFDIVPATEDTSLTRLAFESCTQPINNTSLSKDDEVS